jgi:enoyl-CoA hydratase
MAGTEFIDNYKGDFLGHWSNMTKVRKPIVAAVNGYAVCGKCGNVGMWEWLFVFGGDDDDDDDDDDDGG